MNRVPDCLLNTRIRLIPGFVVDRPDTLHWLACFLMLHPQHHSWIEPTVASRWSVDSSPRARLACLFVIFLVPILAVCARLIWLQLIIPERFVSAWNKQTESLETLPARDGRILTADGQVLAVDQTRYSLSIHYRWIEEPMNRDWLKAKARESLPREARKNSARIAAAEADILLQRDQMWEKLSQLTEVSPTQLQLRRQAIQRQVERISESVNQRNQEHNSQRRIDNSAQSFIARLWNELSTPPARDSSQPIILKEELEAHSVIDEVTVEVMAVIESQSSRFPGVELHQKTKRSYPQGDLASHLIGLRVPIGESELKLRRNRFPQGDPLALELGDRLGRDGIERTYDSQLRGLRGLKRVVRNHSGEVVQQQVIRPPRHGADVTVTLDASLQRQAEQLLDRFRPRREQADHDLSSGNHARPSPRPPGPHAEDRPLAGSIVVMDVRNGELLVAANSPRVSLNILQHPSQEQWHAWTSDPLHPFVSRVTQATISPGTLFQTVTAIAGLEQGVIGRETAFRCPLSPSLPAREQCTLFRQTGKGHGEVDLISALSLSCSACTCDLAERLGPQPIQEWARRMGFGSPTGIDIGGESSGNVPSLSVRLNDRRWYPGMTRQLALGQGELTVTPLQVTCLMACIGNGGRSITPRLVSHEQSLENLERTDESIQLVNGHDRPAERSGVISRSTLAPIHQALRQSIEHPRGSGHAAQTPGITIAGSSGTASAGSEQPTHAWFAGYVPADRPRYAVVVYLEHGGSGDTAAAPLARQIVMSLMEADLLSPTP